MQLKFVFLLLAFGYLTWVNAQASESRLALTLGVQFHSLGLPFTHLGENFKNLGLSVGTRFRWSKKGAWAQDLQLSWMANRKVGNSWTLYTQMAWQPKIFGVLRLGPQLGLGYSWLEHPVPSFVQENGEWIAQGRRGKAVLSIPLGLSLRLANGSRSSVQPFVSYQMLMYNGYNQGVSVLPNTILQLGTQIPLH